MLKPSSERELAEIVCDAPGPLALRGGGTRPIGCPVEGKAVSTAGLSGISLYEPGALTLVAAAGTPVAEIETAVAAEGQRLAFEPMDHRTLLGTEGAPTIGGVVAVNASGPRRVQAGACRDGLLGVRFIDGTGTLVKNGGRVMKNVTGYDLVKLMAGSYGTLGVLTEVSLKVLPAPEAIASLSVAGLGVERAVEAMSVALGSPYEVTGAAHQPGGTDMAAATVLRIEGFEASVTYRAERLKELLEPFGSVTILREPDRVERQWRAIRDVEALAGGEGAVWRISVRPSDAPVVVARLPEADLLLDWGGGLIWARLPEEVDLRAALAGLGGHATLLRASAEMLARGAVFEPQPAPVASIAEGLRARFDPRGILNPGRMG